MLLPVIVVSFGLHSIRNIPSAFQKTVPITLLAEDRDFASLGGGEPL